MSWKLSSRSLFLSRRFAKLPRFPLTLISQSLILRYFSRFFNFRRLDISRRDEISRVAGERTRSVRRSSRDERTSEIEEIVHIHLVRSIDHISAVALIRRNDRARRQQLAGNLSRRISPELYQSVIARAGTRRRQQRRHRPLCFYRATQSPVEAQPALLCSPLLPYHFAPPESPEVVAQEHGPGPYGWQFSWRTEGKKEREK